MRTWGIVTAMVSALGGNIVLSHAVFGAERNGMENTPRAMVGAYYFDGWSGRSELADDPNEAWAKNAPTHLTRKLVEDFPQREPVWGWRDDSLEIMERQIDLAADHGVAFFAFCWYWHDNGQAINEDAIKTDPKQTSLRLFLKARNNHRMKFCLLVANHEGHEIKGTANWKRAGEFWMPYLTHKQYLTVGGKPFIIIFGAGGGDKAGFSAMQETAFKAGLPGLAIAGCAHGPVTPEMGFTHRTHYNVTEGYTAGSKDVPFSKLVDSNRAQWRGSREQPYIPIVTAGWDKRPWEGKGGLGAKEGWYYTGRTPDLLGNFLSDAISWMDKHPDQTTTERIVLIYAWNEFGEGGYIAPTKGDPDGKYLKAVRSEIMPTTHSGQPPAGGDGKPAPQP